jgi:lysophospholipase L1-like esterase
MLVRREISQHMLIFPPATPSNNRFFLTSVMVQSDLPTRVIVAFGDSITDGTNSTVNTNSRWLTF